MVRKWASQGRTFAIKTNVPRMEAQMMFAQDGTFDKSKKIFEGILGHMERGVANGQRISEVEERLHGELHELGRLLLQEHVDAQGTGDFGATFEYEGRVLRRLPVIHDRRLVTVFGELTIRRTVYGSRETQWHEVVPVDARLGLPTGDFSPLLEDWAQSMCVENAYGKSRNQLKRMLGFPLTVRSLETMNERMSNDVASFRETESAPPAEAEGRILVATADGKGVPMRRDPSEETGHDAKRRTKGQKKNKKREACVGAVYTIDPFHRKPADIVDEIRRRRRGEQRPRPCHKHVRAELTRWIDGVEKNGKDLTFEWLAQETALRNPDGKRPLVCLMDGDRALWSMQQEHIPAAIGVLDLFHVLERLWSAAHCFHPEGSDEAEAFVEERLLRILQGQVGYVIGGLKQMMTKHRLRGSRRERLQSVITYYKNNRQYMKYDEYLKAGYPIGSGVAEGACRHLVKDRMELTGMRWCVEGAQAMLNMRAIYLNDQWDAFNRHRVDQEQRCLYPYRSTIQAEWKRAA